MSGALLHSGTCAPGSLSSPLGPTETPVAPKSALVNPRNMGKILIARIKLWPPWLFLLHWIDLTADEGAVIGQMRLQDQ